LNCIASERSYRSNANS